MEPREEELIIDITNVEDIVFWDEGLWTKMPEIRHIRDQWSFSKISPELAPTGKSAMIDFLSLSDHRYELLLSEHFGKRVTIDKMDRRSVVNLEFDTHSCPDLNSMSPYSGFGCFRKGNTVKVTFWR